MTNLPQKEQIREAINSYCKARGLSKSELANQLQISAATLSKVENRKWEDIDEKMWRKIWNRVQEAIAAGLFSTAAFATCHKVCAAAQKHRFMIGITADTGIGKTTALTAYAMRKNVFYVVYDKTMKPRQFFVALLREMGISFEGSINEMVDRIADELNTLASPLLIIDEAGKITHTMILYLHVLRDKTQKNCGIVLAGMPYFRSNLVKFAGKQKEGFAEFLRRVNLWQELGELTPSEIRAICEHHGITDAEAVRDLRNKKRFGDLYNAILLYQLENEVDA